MNKYLSIFKISLAQEFTYKLSFFMWRLRNVMQILIFYFLWTSVLADPGVTFFGYDQKKIVAYAFLLIIVRAIVLSARSVDVSGQIANGDLANFILKPLNFFKYWMVRDFSSKFLNVSFSVVEIFVLFVLLKPNIYIQTNPITLVLFMAFLLIASFLFFNILMITNFVPFWIPEVSWGAQFLVVGIIVEFLSGAFFPLDVFPTIVYNFIKFTPFPYLLFVPIKLYLGSLNYQQIAEGFVISIVWCFLLNLIRKKVWENGLKVFEAVGR